MDEIERVDTQARPATARLVRLRIRFAKISAMRYTGHLDLHRAWERTFRRAGLPLAYSQGYNPHPRLNLASALPLGFTSQDEVIDAWLEQDLPLEQVLQALERALPPGLLVKQVEEVELHAPALQTELQASEFLITFLEPVDGLEERLRKLLAAESLIRSRRNKEYDLRPLILEVEFVPDERPASEAQPRLLACLSAREGATGRPEELVEALGADPTEVRVERTRLIFQRS
jgi:radical SAM-linked protein